MNSVYFFLPFLIVASLGIYQDSFGETIYRGESYTDIKNPDGSHTFRTEAVPYILDSQNKYVPFILTGGNKVETNYGSVILNADGSYSFYKKGIINSQMLFNDTIVAKYADVSDLTNWTYPTTLNNDVPDNSFDGTQFISTKSKTGIGKLEYKYMLVNGQWKTQLEATNLSSLTTKAFGFDQIIDLKTDTIFFGGQSRNLDNFDGSTFDKNWLNNNKGKVINFLNGMSFDFDLGFENLYSVTIYNTGPNASRLVFDYRTSTPLLPNQKLIIDPTYSSISPNDNGEVQEADGTNDTCSNPGVTVFRDNSTSTMTTKIVPTGFASDCWFIYLDYNIASIPTNAVVTDVDFDFDVQSVSSPRNCDYNSMGTTRASASDVNVFNAIFSGTTMLSNDATCTTAGNNKSVDLGTAGNTAVQTRVTAGDGFFTFGIKPTTVNLDGSSHDVVIGSTRDATATPKPTLTITYIMPPDKVTDLTSTAITTSTVNLDWTAPSAGGGGQSIIGYQINITTPQTGTPLVFLNDTGSATTDYLASGLSHGTDYSARVSAWTNNTGAHPFNNATGNVYNFTTTSNSYTGAPVLTASSNTTTAILLQWTANAIDNINGYKIQRETPIGTEWSTLVGNTTTTTLTYNNTGLSTNIIYNYRIYAINGSGFSAASNEYPMTTYHLPDAVTTLTGTSNIDISTIDLDWDAPTSYAPAILGYYINYTTPEGSPLTPTTDSPVMTTDTEYTVTNLQIGVDYSFRVAALTVHGTNASGNIWNGSLATNYVIGDFSNPDVDNENDFKIFFERDDINDTSLYLNVTYPDSYDLACDFVYKFARLNDTYGNLTSTASGTDDLESSFLFVNASGDIIDVKCYDTITGDSAKYILTITDFELLNVMDNLRNGTYGTLFQFGAIDGITLVVVFLSMIGLNRVTPIVGIIFVVITTFALSFFEVITYPVIMYPAMALMVFWAYISTRKDD